MTDCRRRSFASALSSAPKRHQRQDCVLETGVITITMIEQTCERLASLAELPR